MEKNKRNITISRIFKLIEESKMTVKDFAQEIGIPNNCFTDWKTGRSNPSVKSLRTISKKCNVQLEWLTGDCRYKTKEEEFERNNN